MTQVVSFGMNGKQEDGTIGKAYGYQIAQETYGQKSQLHYVINELKKESKQQKNYDRNLGA